MGFVASLVLLIGPIKLLSPMVTWRELTFGDALLGPVVLGLLILGIRSLRLSAWGVSGIACGLLVITNLIWMLVTSSLDGIMGVLFFGILSFVLLQRGLFRKERSR